MANPNRTKAHSIEYFENRRKGNYGLIQDMLAPDARLIVKGAEILTNGRHFDGRWIIAQTFRDFDASSKISEYFSELVVVDMRTILRWTCSKWHVETRTMYELEVVNFLTFENYFISKVDQLHVVLNAEIVLSDYLPGCNDRMATAFVHEGNRAHKISARRSDAGCAKRACKE